MPGSTTGTGALLRSSRLQTRCGGVWDLLMLYSCIRFFYPLGTFLYSASGKA